MVRIRLLAVAIAFTAIAAASKIGQPAPSFTLRDENRKPVSLSSARGHKVVLVFYRGYW